MSEEQYEIQDDFRKAVWQGTLEKMHARFVEIAKEYRSAGWQIMTVDYEIEHGRETQLVCRKGQTRHGWYLVKQ